MAAQQDSVRKDSVRSPELPDTIKVGIDETRIFDPSTFPPSLGEREAIRVELLKPPKPQNTFAETPQHMHGKITSGYGTYVSPMIKGWVGTNSATSDLMLRGGFALTEGHAPNRDSRKGNVRLSAGVYLSENAGMLASGRLESVASLDHHKYRLYGSDTPSRARTVNSFDGNVSISTSYADGGFLKGKFQLERSTMNDSVQMDETELGMEIAFGARMGQFSLEGTTNVWYDFYTTSVPTHDPSFAEGTLAFHYRPSDRFDLFAVGVAYDVRGTEYRKRRWVALGGGFEWHAGKSVSVFAEYRPYVQRNNLMALAKANPFLHYRIQVEQTEYRQNGVAGVVIRSGDGFTARISAAYKEAYKFPIYWHRRENLWSVEYEWTTRILSFDTELHAAIKQNVVAGLTFSYRDTRDLVTRQVFPYNPKVVISALYRHQISSKLLLESDLQYVGNRYTTMGGGTKLRPLNLWNLIVGYSFSPRVSMSVTIENILDQQRAYWEGYTGQPRRGALSVEIMW